MKEQFPRFFHGTLEASIFQCICWGDNAAFVTIKLNGTKVAETSHELGRMWNQTFHILCAHPLDTNITITLKTRFSILGKIHIPVQRLLQEPKCVDGCFPLYTEKGKRHPRLELKFCLCFKDAEADPRWGRGLNCGGFSGLKGGVSFPQRSNCWVTLYQDAHHRHSFQPPIYIDGGENYKPKKLWEDVYKAMDGAKYLIYIAAWSFNPKMVLVRDPETDIPHAKGITIGELLKRKAEEGVSVRIMLWNDETSLPIIKNQGVMRTHDQDAMDFFRHTKVVCKLCPRLHHKFPTLFAHHQKTITVDTQAQLDVSSRLNNYGKIDTNSREIMSFVGGLDLCDGRYDTEEHSLFRTLNTESHVHDFYQINFEGASLHRGGPREPWHDVHVCITGEAAWDVLANFEQRWTKQCNSSWLVSTSEIPNLLEPSHPTVGSVNDWNVQIFRSIDHISTRSLHDNLPAECSIHEAYVDAIRRAERFIYIENQYFIGSCHMWEKDQHCGCKNLIPVEIAMKVVSKIRARERFAVYIVIPMWPEGVPESEPVQEILHWTRLTMAMMYRLIGEAIQETNEGLHPRDYLNFFCLANREVKDRNEFVPPRSPQHATHYWKAQRHRRFMIYVHSKLIIVDDEYILIGSANINQRSMDGRRDTEIATGCYQPEFVGDKRNHGAVHAYRMSLWYEHTGCLEEVFLEPHNIDCVRRMVTTGEKMWMIYTREDVVNMGGKHLVNFPVSISKDGFVEDLVTGDGTFPDTNTLVKGKKSMLLPPACTT